MSDDWVPQNKEQEFGFQRGKTFVQGFTDQINDLKAEIQRAGVQMERDRLDIDRLKRNEREYEKTAGKDTAGICKENADLKDALKIANGLLSQLRKDNRELRTHLVKLADLAAIYSENNAQLAETVRSGIVIRAREALGLTTGNVL